MRYFEEVYQFMDEIYDNLGDVTYDLIKNALKKYRLDLKYLIIDATRIKVWKDKETGLVRFGYSSGNELKNLPQVNLVLGVNSQQIPLFANTYPGNTSDVKMFEDFIHRINTRYRSLTQKVKDKFVIFDQGNVNEDNIKYLRTFKKDGIHFVSMVRTNSTPRFIKEIDKSSMPLIYSSEKSKNEVTCIYGALIDGKVYEKRSRVLVCYNPDLMGQRCQTMDRRVAEVKQAVTDGESLEDVSKLISKYNLKRALKPIEEGGKLKLEVNETEIAARKEHYGFFTLFTDHRGLSAEEIIAIYKSRNLVEEGFRALKSDSKIDPVYHSKDMRIETHTVLVVAGYLITSLLRAILNRSGMEHSFGGLKDVIKSGNAVEGFYEHEQLRNRLYIYRPVKPTADLEAIFRELKIKVPTFDVKEVIPTNIS
jgi:transposase